MGGTYTSGRQREAAMPITAAVYCRKSTKDDRGTADQSVARQADLAQRYATAQGWSVPAEFVFTDNEVSAADWKSRLAWKALRTAADDGRFTRLVVMDQSRISRDQKRGPAEIGAVEDAGVEIWGYATNQRISFDDDADDGSVIASSANSMVDTVHRRNARRLASEALRRKVEQGYVGGGFVYGYRNVDVGAGKKRDHVVREIHPAQAAIVRRIFQMSAEGLGFLKIAKTLNAEHLDSPTGNGWASSGVREMLRRDLYRGIIVYGKTKWRRTGEHKHKVPTIPSTWIRVEAPELRIVSEDLWQAVQLRRAKTIETYAGRKTNGQLVGRRETGLFSKILLSGFLRCGTCGANLITVNRSGGTKKMWICSTAHRRGKTRCANTRAIPFDPLTQAVTETFRENFLNPVAIGQLLAHELAERSAAPDAAKAEIAQIRADLAKVERELPRLVEAVAVGTDPVPALMEAIQIREDRRVALSARLEALENVTRAADEFDVESWLVETRELLADTRNLLEANPAAGRQLLRRCLVKPVIVSPDSAGGWTYETEGRFIAAELAKVVEGADVVMLGKRGVPVDERRVRGHIPSPLSGVPPCGRACSRRWAGPARIPLPAAPTPR
jgi:site-specific DNA recombinase